MSDKQEWVDVSITISVSAESVRDAYSKAAVSLVKLQSIFGRTGGKVREVNLSTVFAYLSHQILASRLSPACPGCLDRSGEDVDMQKAKAEQVEEAQFLLLGLVRNGDVLQAELDKKMSPNVLNGWNDAHRRLYQ